MSKNEDSIQVNRALSEEMQFKELLLSLLDFGYDIFAVAVQELNKRKNINRSYNHNVEMFGIEKRENCPFWR